MTGYRAGPRWYTMRGSRGNDFSSGDKSVRTPHGGGKWSATTVRKAFVS
jgi:hypothetical protein